MNENNDATRFVGLTKTQFLMALICLFAMATLISISVLALSVSSSAAIASSSRQEVDIARQLAIDVKSAVCGMKDSTRKQIRTTTTFLIDHPGAEPIPGVSRKVLTDGLARQRAFLDTMEGLDCT